MHLIAPDVLAEARGLSPFLSGAGVLLGFFLWLCGWRWHRFWIVVVVTLVGGLIGLQTGRSSGGHILAMGVLLALSAGLLALEVARLFSFLAAGTAIWMAANALFPQGRELWVAFLIGGLVGVLLYRFWTMLLSSFGGVLLSWHACLCLIETLIPFDAAHFADQNSAILTGGALVATIMGVVAQSLLERLYLRRKKRRKLEQEEKIREDERDRMMSENTLLPLAQRSIWDKLRGRKKRAA